jgi:hypothetical protein
MALLSEVQHVNSITKMKPETWVFCAETTRNPDKKTDSGFANHTHGPTIEKEVLSKPN